MRWIVEAIEINVHFEKDGRVDPQSFTWRGQVHRIDHSGRRWEAEDGEHILVMTPAERIFELLYVRAEGCWYLVNVSPSGTRA